MKTIYKPLGLLFILLAGSFSLVKAQDNTQAINLETVLQLGGANNLTILRYQQKQDLALAELNRAREWWLPDIYAGTSVNQLWGATMNSDGRFFTDVNSQNFWGGAGINASWTLSESFFKTKTENLKAQAARFLTDAERNKALLEIIEAYYDLLAAQLYFSAYDQLVDQGDTISQQISIQVQAGMRYESELLLSQSNQSHLKVEMMNAKMSYSTKSAALVNLLNLSPDVKLVSTDSILAPLDLLGSEEIILNDSIYNKRPEFNAAKLTLRSLQVEKRITSTGLWIPDLQMGTYTSMFGDVLSPLYPTSAINASLMWKIPIGRLTYGGELAKARLRIRLQETEIKQVKAIVNEEVLRTRGMMSISKEQMEIARKGSDQASKALQQSIQRQQLGTVRPFEILQVQEIYIRSKLDYLKAVTTYNKAQYQLFVAVGGDL